MNIYVSHSRHFFDYKKELYAPLQDSALAKKHQFIFPHSESDAPFNSKEKMQSGEFDLILAEVSFPATGQGIELGWADFCNIPILCIYKKGQKVGGSLRALTDKILEYNDSSDLISKLTIALNEFKN